MPPRAAATCSTTWAASSATDGAPRSSSYADACTPHSRLVSTTADAVSGRERKVTATSEPRLASIVVIASPRPPLPPMTSATPVRAPKSFIDRLHRLEVGPVPAGSAVGQGVLLVARLDLAVRVDRAYGEGVLAGLDVDRRRPLHPGVRAPHPADVGGLPRSVVDGDLHRRDPGVLR